MSNSLSVHSNIVYDLLVTFSIGQIKLFYPNPLYQITYTYFFNNKYISNIR